MYENKCAICGQPIIGYWYEVGKKNVCQLCAASTTVYDLFQHDIIDIKPDIVDGIGTLVTKDGEESESNLTKKSVLNAAYGMAVSDIEEDDDGYHYTDEDMATALGIIKCIKARGFNTEQDFFEECNKLWNEGAHPRPEENTYSDADNSLLILRKKYDEIMPSPRYEGDVGNDTWGAMLALWK